jgi:hypothetical protein
MTIWHYLFYDTINVITALRQTKKPYQTLVRRLYRNKHNASVHWKHPSSPSLKQFKVKSTPSAGKVMLTVFWDSQGVLLAHFQKCGENVNSASYCDILLKLRDAIRRKRPGQVARGVLLYHDNARPHTDQATQKGIQELQWEFSEHQPSSRDSDPIDLPLFGPLKPPWWQTFRWWRRAWNGGAGVAETAAKRLLCCGFRRTGNAMGQVYQCWWRICREIDVFPGSNITCFTFYIHLWLFTDSPSYFIAELDRLRACHLRPEYVDSLLLF